MVGDGMYATIATGSKNFVDETPTFSTATFGNLSNFQLLDFNLSFVVLRALSLGPNI